MVPEPLKMECGTGSTIVTEHSIDAVSVLFDHLWGFVFSDIHYMKKLHSQCLKAALINE